MIGSMNNRREALMRIRPASPDDFWSVPSLFRQLWPDKVSSKERQQAVFHAMLEADGYELLCAEMDEAIIGFASLSGGAARLIREHGFNGRGRSGGWD